MHAMPIKATLAQRSPPWHGTHVVANTVAQKLSLRVRTRQRQTNTTTPLNRTDRFFQQPGLQHFFAAPINASFKYKQETEYNRVNTSREMR
jgi:hypothetical protein